MYIFDDDEAAGKPFRLHKIITLNHKSISQ